MWKAKKTVAPKANKELLATQETYDAALLAFNAATDALKVATDANENDKLADLQVAVDDAKVALDAAKDNLDSFQDWSSTSDDGYEVLVNLKHNWTRYAVGDRIQISEDEAEKLIADWSIL